MQPESILDLLTAVEHALLVHALDHLSASHAAGVNSWSHRSSLPPWSAAGARADVHEERFLELAGRSEHTTAQIAHTSL